MTTDWKQSAHPAFPPAAGSALHQRLSPRLPENNHRICRQTSRSDISAAPFKTMDTNPPMTMPKPRYSVSGRKNRKNSPNNKTRTSASAVEYGRGILSNFEVFIKWSVQIMPNVQVERPAPVSRAPDASEARESGKSNETHGRRSRFARTLGSARLCSSVQNQRNQSSSQPRARKGGRGEPCQDFGMFRQRTRKPTTKPKHQTANIGTNRLT
jgi:hypothetical protein